MKFQETNEKDTYIKWWDVFAGVVVFLIVLWLIARGGQAITEFIGAHR